MKKLRSTLIIVLLIGILSAGLYYGNHFYKIAKVACGFAAKTMASGVFISRRNPESILKAELNNPLLDYFDYRIDSTRHSVTFQALFGLIQRTAYLRDGLGATLDLPENQKNIKVTITKKPSTEQAQIAWPAGELVNLEQLPPEVDQNALITILDEAFADPDTTHPRQTRGIVVVYNGQIIAEKYGNGFTRDMPQLGWSMTKSVINALVGIMVKQGKLAIEAAAAIPEWNKPNDPRKEITLNHLLQMSSGLEFAEEYSHLLSDVVQMLFLKKSAANFALNKPLIAEPGTKFSYASGTTNIICKILKQSLGGDDLEYLKFPREALFNPLGMPSAIIEPDAAGIFVGSSFMYATARDWARFGLLYLQDGIWNGERILPEGWVKYTTTPTTTSKHPIYGAHFWLYPPAESTSSDTLLNGISEARGHDGQFVSIIPQKNMVVVRLGYSPYHNWDQEDFLKKVLLCIRKND